MFSIGMMVMMQLVWCTITMMSMGMDHRVRPMLNLNLPPTPDFSASTASSSDPESSLNVLALVAIHLSVYSESYASTSPTSLNLAVIEPQQESRKRNFDQIIQNRVAFMPKRKINVRNIDHVSKAL